VLWRHDDGFGPCSYPKGRTLINKYIKTIIIIIIMAP